MRFARLDGDQPNTPLAIPDTSRHHFADWGELDDLWQ